MMWRVGLAIAFLAVGCGSERPPAATTEALQPSVEHVAMATGDLYLPASDGEAPLVVLVPGGAWRTADPTGLVGLAVALAERGIATMTTTVRAADDGVVYPVPVEDTVCAVSAAATAIGIAGIQAGPVVVLGHSSGAHLAALAALVPERHEGTCADPPRAADALIGISGTYDVASVPDLAIDLIGAAVSEAPELWDEANPLLLADRRPEMPVLLLHGEADRLVPMGFTDDFAAALRAGGHAVTVVTVPDADHHQIYRPEAVAGPIADWIEGLSS
jgi:acetyl esterase/lipase